MLSPSCGRSREVVVAVVARASGRTARTAPGSTRSRATAGQSTGRGAGRARAQRRPGRGRRGARVRRQGDPLAVVGGAGVAGADDGVDLSGEAAGRGLVAWRRRCSAATAPLQAAGRCRGGAGLVAREQRGAAADVGDRVGAQRDAAADQRGARSSVRAAPCQGERAGPVRVPGLQRDRRDAARRPWSARGAVGADAARGPARSNQSDLARVLRRGPTARPSGRRRGRDAALGHPVHPPSSSRSQRRVGRRLVDAGADLVVGGHPHWVQGLERYQRRRDRLQRWATSSSTWTSWSRRWRESRSPRRSAATGCRRDRADAVPPRRPVRSARLGPRAAAPGASWRESSGPISG